MRLFNHYLQVCFDFKYLACWIQQPIPKLWIWIFNILFDQLEQVLQVLFVYCLTIWLVEKFVKIKDSKFRIWLFDQTSKIFCLIFFVSASWYLHCITNYSLYPITNSDFCFHYFLRFYQITITTTTIRQDSL